MTAAPGRLYCLVGGQLLAFDTATGARVWKFATDVADPLATPPVVVPESGRALLVRAPSGDRPKLVALDTATGAEAWRFDVKLGSPHRPTVTGGPGRAVFLSATEGLYAFDATDGHLRWTVPATDLPDNQLGFACAVAHGDTVYALDKSIVSGQPGATLAAFAAATGQMRWHQPVRRLQAAGQRPLVTDGETLFGAEDYIVAVNAQDGVPRWEIGPNNPMRLALTDTMLVMATPGAVLGLNKADGDLRWRAEVPSQSDFGGPVVDGGTAYVVSADALTAIDADGGGVRWTFRVPGTQFWTLAVAERTVFVAGASSGTWTVYAVEA